MNSSTSKQRSRARKEGGGGIVGSLTLVESDA